MSNKKKPALSKAILNLLILIPTFLNVISKVTTLVELEAHLAGKNLIRLIVLAVAFGSLLVATWVSALGMLFIYFQHLSWTPLFSLCVIFFLNVFILMVIGICLRHARKNIAFPAIRNQLRHLKKLFQD